MSSMTELTTLSRMESPRGCRSHRLPRGAYLRTPLGSHKRSRVAVDRVEAR